MITLPHLLILGIPLFGSQHTLGGLDARLKAELSQIAELEIGPENVFIFTPPDLAQRNGLIVCHAILFDAPKRTPKIRKKFAETITKVIQEFYPRNTVKCMPHRFNREKDGYSTRDPKIIKTRR